MSNRPRDFHQSWGKKKSLEQVLSERAPGSCRTLSNLIFPERMANFIGPRACWVILNLELGVGESSRGHLDQSLTPGRVLPEKGRGVCSNIQGHQWGLWERKQALSTCRE